jgi:ATP-dependent helicase/nuclease subunit A
MEQGDSNTVKIMTVHGSKGLQAPIVILADTVRVKKKPQNASFLWDDDLFYFPISSSNYNDICLDINNSICEDNMDEYRRLLYVALTRAEDRIYIAGYTKDKNINSESWYGLLKDNIKSNIKLLENDKRIVYEINQENTFEKENKTLNDAIDKIPDFSSILTDAPIESPLTKPYTPSKDETQNDELVSSPLEDSGNFYKRGIAIHKLLQYITNIDEANRHNACLLFLKKELPTFSDKEYEDISKEVLGLCHKYKDIFSSNSLSEVPIIGEVDGKIISSKIDRLIIKDDVVIIVDYKTNRPAAKTLDDVPLIYLKQLSSYKRLLESIYPNKKVETYLLWTNTCNMMKI